MQLYLNDLTCHPEQLSLHKAVITAMETADVTPRGFRFVRVSIADGRAETTFRQNPRGIWEYSTSYCDRCFGHITQRFQPLRRAAA